jgi:hypothetical protein
MTQVGKDKAFLGSDAIRDDHASKIKPLRDSTNNNTTNPSFATEA